MGTISSLSLEELRQVGTGNNLLQFAFGMMFRLALVQASGVLEHPEQPEEDTKPSIWKLSIMRWLRMMPGMQTFSFSQGLLGAPTPKPTRLLVLNLSDLMNELRRYHLSKDLPRRSAIGLDDAGAWRTGVLKEYPPAMSRALAACFVASLLKCPFDADRPQDEGFVQICRRVQVSTYGECYGADFAQP